MAEGDHKSQKFPIGDSCTEDQSCAPPVKKGTCCLRPLIHSDINPACFWISNFNNHFIDNACAGSRARGFHFEPIMMMPFKHTKTGMISPGLRCMQPHMKNHPWCINAKSVEGPYYDTGSKFQRAGLNLDAWAIVPIGKFSGNVAHSVNSGIWISGCTKNVAVFENTVVHHTLSGFSWLKTEGTDVGNRPGFGKGGFNCDQLGLDAGWDRDQDVEMAGHEARFVLLKNFVSADNLYNGRWDGAHNFGFEWIDPLLVGFSKNKDAFRNVPIGAYIKDTPESDGVNHRMGILTAWTTRIKGAVCAGFPFDLEKKEQNACFGSSARLHETLQAIGSSGDGFTGSGQIPNHLGSWASVIPTNPTSQIIDFFSPDRSNPIWFQGEHLFGNNYAWMLVQPGSALRNSAVEDVDGTLFGVGPHSVVHGDNRKWKVRSDTKDTNVRSDGICVCQPGVDQRKCQLAAAKKLGSKYTLKESRCGRLEHFHKFDDQKTVIQNLFAAPAALNTGVLGSARASEDRCRFLPSAQGFVCKGETDSNVRQIHIHKGQGGNGYLGAIHGAVISISTRHDGPQFSDWGRANDNFAVEGSPNDECNYPLYMTDKFGAQDQVMCNKYTSNSELFGSDMQTVNLMTSKVSSSESMPVYKFEMAANLYAQKVKFVCEDPRNLAYRFRNSRMTPSTNTLGKLYDTYQPIKNKKMRDSFFATGRSHPKGPAEKSSDTFDVDYEKFGLLDGFLIPKESAGYDQRHCFFFNQKNRNGGAGQNRPDSSKCELYKEAGKGFDSLTYTRADFTSNPKKFESVEKFRNLPSAINDVRGIDFKGGSVQGCVTHTWYPTRPAMNMADQMTYEIPPTINESPDSELHKYATSPPSDEEGVKLKMDVPGGLLIRLVRAPSYLQQTLDLPYKVTAKWGATNNNKGTFSQGKRLDTSLCNENAPFGKLAVKSGVYGTFKQDTEETKKAKVIGEDWGSYNCKTGELTIEVAGTNAVNVETVICNGHGEWGQSPLYTCVCHKGWGGNNCGDFQDPCADNADGNHYWAELFVNNPFLRETPLVSKCVKTPSLSMDDIALAKKQPWKAPWGELLTDTPIQMHSRGQFPSMEFYFSYSARFTAPLRKVVAEGVDVVTAYAEADTGFRLAVDNDVLINEWYVGLLSEGQPGWHRSAVSTWAEPQHHADIKTKMRTIRRGSAVIDLTKVKKDSVISLEYYYANNIPSSRPHVSLALKQKAKFSPAVPGTLLGCVDRNMFAEMKESKVVAIERTREREFEDGQDIVPDGITVDRCLTACVGYEMAAVSSKKDECRCLKDSKSFLKEHSQSSLQKCSAKKSQRPPCSGDTRRSGCGSSTEADMYLVAESGFVAAAESNTKFLTKFQRYTYEKKNPTCAQSPVAGKCQGQHLRPKKVPLRTYVLQDKNTRCASLEEVLTTAEECQKALKGLGLDTTIKWSGGAWGHVPAGCSYGIDNLGNPNTHFTKVADLGSAHGGLSPICFVKSEEPRCKGETCTADDCCEAVPLPTCSDSPFGKCEGKNTHGVQYSKRQSAFEKSATCASYDGCKVEECCEAIPTCIKDKHICEKSPRWSLKEEVLNPEKIYTLQKTNTFCAPESVIRTKEECAEALAKVGKSSNIGYSGDWLTGHNVPAGCSENHFNSDFSSTRTRDNLSPICVTEKKPKPCAGDTCTLDECCDKQPSFCSVNQCDGDNKLELKQEMVTPKRIYTLKETNTRCDNPENIIRTKEECEKALTKVGKSPHIGYVGGPWGHVPAGCTYNPSHSHFNNNNAPGNAHHQMAPVCVTEEKPKPCASGTCTVDDCCKKYVEPAYVKQATNTLCPAGKNLHTVEECQKALKTLGLSTHIAYVGGPWGHVPAACSYNPNHSHFNKNDSPGGAHHQMAPVCLE